MTDIIPDGHPALRKKAEPVSLPASEQDKEILRRMLEYIQNSQDPEIAEKYQLRPGIGLAAPQINISKRMIAIHIMDEDGSVSSYALFNPKIISHSIQKSFLASGEGCLSVDTAIPGYVPRYSKVKISGVNLDGAQVNIRATGLTAICFQHEIDHLNGVMFYDHINKDNPHAPLVDAIAV